MRRKVALGWGESDYGYVDDHDDERDHDHEDERVDERDYDYD
jgi:hypothetical protein